MATKNLVLRTIYIDPDVDDQLRTEAFDSRTSKNDLMRRYLRLGMETERLRREPALAESQTAAAASAVAGPVTRPAAKSTGKTRQRSTLRAAIQTVRRAVEAGDLAVASAVFDSYPEQKKPKVPRQASAVAEQSAPRADTTHAPSTGRTAARPAPRTKPWV